MVGGARAERDASGTSLHPSTPFSHPPIHPSTSQHQPHPNSIGWSVQGAEDIIGMASRPAVPRPPDSSPSPVPATQMGGSMIDAIAVDDEDVNPSPSIPIRLSTIDEDVSPSIRLSTIDAVKLADVSTILASGEVLCTVLRLYEHLVLGVDQGPSILPSVHPSVRPSVSPSRSVRSSVYAQLVMRSTWPSCRNQRCPAYAPSICSNVSTTVLTPA